ncbi:hypothetical protein ElyMa_004164600 [Elysia marginata]|uniref:Uncharacterized protein n=1 Tax=Elysia marginata TaxID=1093978 RepID=A0AAV4GK92_9GAST|nr:hypothetical protein ElyMa_004164600 [Elysia marginata]
MRDEAESHSDSIDYLNSYFVEAAPIKEHTRLETSATSKSEMLSENMHHHSLTRRNSVKYAQQVTEYNIYTSNNNNIQSTACYNIHCNTTLEQ